MADRVPVAFETLIGDVTQRSGAHWMVEVRTPDVPAHLLEILLTDKQMGDAKIGDRVEMRYITTTPSSGLWWVTRVIL